jgi:fructose-specific component phosphotransferase system IIB-like protein
MKKQFLYLIISVAFTFTSAAQKSEQMKWMTGTWKMNAGSSVIAVQWQIANDSILTGKSYFIKDGKDTIPQETIEMANRNGDWYYIPTVKNQNNAQPVYFKVIFLEAIEFISENPAHDFPQRIAYRRIKNQLFASIEGRQNGKYGKQNFDFLSD